MSKVLFNFFDRAHHRRRLEFGYLVESCTVPWSNAIVCRWHLSIFDKYSSIIADFIYERNRSRSFRTPFTFNGFPFFIETFKYIENEFINMLVLIEDSLIWLIEISMQTKKHFSYLSFYHLIDKTNFISFTFSNSTKCEMWIFRCDVVLFFSLHRNNWNVKNLTNVNTPIQSRSYERGIVSDGQTGSG